MPKARAVTAALSEFASAPTWSIEETLDWIGRDRGRPFLAFLNYFDVHDPYGGPRDYPKPSWPR